MEILQLNEEESKFYEKLLAMVKGDLIGEVKKQARKFNAEDVQ